MALLYCIFEVAANSLHHNGTDIVYNLLHMTVHRPICYPHAHKGKCWGPFVLNCWPYSHPIKLVGPGYTLAY